MLQNLGFIAASAVEIIPWLGKNGNGNEHKWSDLDCYEIEVVRLWAESLTDILSSLKLLSPLKLQNKIKACQMGTESWSSFSTKIKLKDCVRWTINKGQNLLGFIEKSEVKFERPEFAQTTWIS